MTKRLDPEMKAINAIDRALYQLDREAQIRVLDYCAKKSLGSLGIDAEVVRRVRLAETLRWSRSWIPAYETVVRKRITRALERYDS